MSDVITENNVNMLIWLLIKNSPAYNIVVTESKAREAGSLSLLRQRNFVIIDLHEGSVGGKI